MWTYVVISLPQIPNNGLAQLYGNYMFNFIKLPSHFLLNFCLLILSVTEREEGGVLNYPVIVSDFLVFLF